MSAVDFTVRVTSATVPAEQKLKVTNSFSFSYDPATPDLRLHYAIDPYSDEHWRLLGNLGRVMAAHKQNVILTPVMLLARPSLAGGAVRYDFSLLDRWIETFRKAGVVGTIEGGHLLGRSGGYFAPVVVPAYVVEGGQIVRKELSADDPRAEQFLSSFLTALYTHLKERGWEKQYIQHVHDEPHDREAPIYMPGIPTIDAVGLEQDIGFSAGVCDIWVPVLGTFDERLDLLQNHLAEDNGAVWFYTCLSPRGKYPNRFIDTSLTKVRLLHWINYKWNFAGFLHWGGNFWGPEPHKDTQPVINGERTHLPPGDAFITYPARMGFYSSIRLEQMREGIEDYALLKELDKADGARAHEIAGEAVRTFVDYVREPGEFRAILQKLLDALE
ncbi:MAG: DUF4091 domain-containing protein [Rubrivivax sp.]|nr:DUF4091 domain-containing protein [Rubrivivax sp.]